MFRLKFPRGKKGIGMDFIVGVIIVLISFAVIAPIASKYVGEDEGKAESLCKSSVALRASTTLNVKGVTEVRSAPVLCKTIDKRIKGDKKEIMKQIADKMVKCWEMFGMGLYTENIFDDVTLPWGEKRCFMCYTMTVDEIKNNEKISAKEFGDFLKNEYHPKIKGQKYLEYIQNYGGGGQILNLLSEEGITQDHTYAIGYKAKKEECKTCNYLKLTNWGAIIVGTGGLLLPFDLLTSEGKSTTSTLIEDAFSSEVKIDSIYLVDLDEHYNLGKLFEKTCEKIEEDIGGK
ncbi:hypothetical protein ACFL0E_00650 [Nanoarchaeota archaeon]